MRINNLVFVHVPKTAGLTTTKVLSEIYGPDKVWSEQRQKELGPFDKNKYNVVKGHFRYDRFPDLDWPIITIVRHPVERIISHYNYAIHNNRPRIFTSRGFKPGVRLLEFAGADINRNAYTKQLGTDLDKFKLVLITEFFDESMEALFNWMGYNKKIKYGVVNKTNKKKPVSEKERRVIKEFNKEDMELYREAKDRFKELSYNLGN
jgi:hypothetical protein